jgi:uncharacterized protein (TIGR04255 family)
MNWEPAHADHSIDSVNVHVSFAEAMINDAFDEVIIPVRRAAAGHHLNHRVESQEPLEVPRMAPGQAVFSVNLNAMPMSRRVAFQRVVDGVVAAEFNIGVRNFTMWTNRYQRWGQFFSQFQDIFAAIDGQWPLSSKVKSIRLQYVDRFLSAPGGANHFEVLAGDPPFLRIPQTDPNAAFHVHTGWFDYDSEPGVRILTNVNIDGGDVRWSPGQEARQLTFLTLLQHEAMGTHLDDPVGRTDILHQRLKNLFRQLISDEAAARVGLSE